MTRAQLNDRLAKAEDRLIRRMTDAELARLAYGDDGSFGWIADCTDAELHRMARGGPPPERFNQSNANANGE